MGLSRLRATDEILLESIDALRDAEADFVAAAENLGVPVLFHDGESIVYANRRFADWLGYTPGQLARRELEVLATEEDQRSLFAALGATPKGPHAVPHIQRFRFRNGQIGVAQVLARSYSREGLSGTLVVSQPESARFRSSEMLRLLEAAVDHLHDIVFITEAESIDDVGRRIVFVNRAYTRITGFEPRDVLGKTPNVTVGPDTDRATLRRIEEGLRTASPVREELLKYGIDGRSYWVEIEIVPIYDEDGVHTHWVSVQRDITERKDLERRLANAEARAALAEKGKSE
jgi:PAS domain S-box-containing protein